MLFFALLAYFWDKQAYENYDLGFFPQLFFSEYGFVSGSVGL